MFECAIINGSGEVDLNLTQAQYQRLKITRQELFNRRAGKGVED